MTVNGFPTITTKRLQLRKLSERDVEKYYDVMSREEVMQYYGMDRLETLEEARQIITSFQQAYEMGRGLRWGIFLKDTEQFIGTIGLNHLNKAAKRTEIGYELHPDHWKQGFMTEAVEAILSYNFLELKLFRIGAITFPDNESSNRLLRRLGFQREGLLRGYLFQNGKSHDAFVYALLKSDWDALKEEQEVDERLSYTDHLTEIIKKAEREGQFDDLPGKGKPLHIGNSYGNSYESQMYKTMKDNHVLPRWVELGKEIDQLKEALQQTTGKEKQRKIKEINKKIKTYNYACPPTLQRNKVTE